jgi:arylsulfatase A-like enzyme
MSRRTAEIKKSKQEITRREFLKLGLEALAGAAVPSSMAHSLPVDESVNAREEVEGNAAPNLVFIFADQLRACSVGCYQNDQVSTPHIDQLASQGVRFTNAISTSPLCGPFRACLMTGRYPTATGIVTNEIKLSPGETGLAEVFRENGYRTGYIGKWHLNGPSPAPVIDPGWVAPKDRQGFQNWTAFNKGHVYYGGKYYKDRDPTLRTIPPGVYEPDFQTDEAIRFITANRRRKFCLFVSIGTPHQQSAGSDLPPGGDYTFPYDPQALSLRPNVDYPDEEYAQQEYADYYGIVSNFDWNVGRILAALQDLQLEAQTIVVVTSDHGDYLGSHYSLLERFRGKSEIYAECLDVPFLLRFPPAIEPGEVDQMFTSVDIMPTLLGLCKLPIPQGVMGRDFTPLLVKGENPGEPPFGPTPSQESALVGMFADDWVGVRTAEFTLACDRLTLAPSTLFHNTQDPYQMTNLVDDPAYLPVREELRQEMIAWLEYVDYPPSA